MPLKLRNDYVGPKKEEPASLLGGVAAAFQASAISAFTPGLIERKMIPKGGQMLEPATVQEKYGFSVDNPISLTEAEYYKGRNEFLAERGQVSDKLWKSGAFGKISVFIAAALPHLGDPGDIAMFKALKLYKAKKALDAARNVATARKASTLMKLGKDSLEIGTLNSIIEAGIYMNESSKQADYNPTIPLAAGFFLPSFLSGLGYGFRKAKSAIKKTEPTVSTKETVETPKKVKETEELVDELDPASPKMEQPKDAVPDGVKAPDNAPRKLKDLDPIVNAVKMNSELDTFFDAIAKLHIAKKAKIDVQSFSRFFTRGDDFDQLLKEIDPTLKKFRRYLTKDGHYNLTALRNIKSEDLLTLYKENKFPDDIYKPIKDSDVHTPRRDNELADTKVKEATQDFDTAYKSTKEANQAVTDIEDVIDEYYKCRGVK